MKPIDKEFKSFKNNISNFKIEMENSLPESANDEWDYINFNYLCDQKLRPINSDYVKDCINNIKKEIEYNIETVHEKYEIVKYLSEIISFYQDTESKIEYDENQEVYSKFFHINDINLEDLNYPEQRKYFEFLASMKTIIRREIAEITLLINNISDNKSKEVASAHMLPNPPLKWRLNKSDLVRLIAALYEVKAFEVSEKIATKTQLREYFQVFFNIDLSNFSDELSKARNTKNNFEFLENLLKGYKKYCAEKDK